MKARPGRDALPSSVTGCRQDSAPCGLLDCAHHVPSGWRLEATRHVGLSVTCHGSWLPQSAQGKKAVERVSSGNRSPAPEPPKWHPVASASAAGKMHVSRPATVTAGCSHRGVVAGKGCEGGRQGPHWSQLPTQEAGERATAFQSHAGEVVGERCLSGDGWTQASRGRGPFPSIPPRLFLGPGTPAPGRR